MKFLVPLNFNVDEGTPLIVRGSVTPATFADILNITGSGYLIGINDTGNNTGEIKVIVDGQTVVSGAIMLNQSAQLSPMIYFYNSLQIQAKGDGSGSEKVIVSCILD